MFATAETKADPIDPITPVQNVWSMSRKLEAGLMLRLRWAGLRGVLGALLAGALVFSGGPLAAKSPATLLPLNYGEAYSAMQSVYSLPILVAQRKGFFVREGLAFQIIMIRGGGGKMVDALDDGEVDLTHVATPFLIQRAMAGSDAVAIAAEFSNPIYALVAKPEFASFSSLKGRLLGMADERGTISYSIWKLLAMHGLHRGDVKVKTISGTPERMQCLLTGPCDAVPLGQPEDFMAIDKRYHRLGLSTDAVPAFVYTVTAARRSWAAAHSDEVARYIRALGLAFRYIRDPAHRDELVRIIAAKAGTPETARQTLALYFDPERHVLPMAGEIDLAGVRQVLAFMAAAGTVRGAPPPERFLDLRYLHAAGAQ